MARPKGRVSSLATVAAPVGGLDDANPFAAMDPRYTIDMYNLFPQTTSLRVRYGYRQWATGFTSVVDTLMEYASDDGTAEFFAACDDGLYDITASGAIGAAVHPLTEGRLNYTMFSTAAAQYLVAVNGQDPSFLYNGTAFIDMIFDATPTNPGEIGGVDPDLFVNVCQHQRRLWFVEEDSMTAWYLPVDAVGGTAIPFYLGSIFRKGGFLQNICTWSRDAGDGVDDILIFQSSEGEVAGYAGTDPASASTWGLEGVYFIGAPLGNRTNSDVGGDLALLTVYGVLPVSRIVGTIDYTPTNEDALSKRITRTLNQLALTTTYNPNWEMYTIPSLQYLVIVIPDGVAGPGVQYVMNMVNGAWGVFRLPLRTLGVFEQSMYFADEDTTVWSYATAFVDGVLYDGTGGDAIESGFMQAYTDFGNPSANKHFKLVRPIFAASVRPAYTLAANPDYGPQRLIDLQTPGPITTQLINVWDTALWDAATWSLGMTSFFEWVGVGGTGYASALLVKMNTSSDTEYMACNWAYEPGNAL